MSMQQQGPPMAPMYQGHPMPPNVSIYNFIVIALI